MPGGANVLRPTRGNCGMPKPNEVGPADALCIRLMWASRVFQNHAFRRELGRVGAAVRCSMTSISDGTPAGSGGYSAPTTESFLPCDVNPYCEGVKKVWQWEPPTWMRRDRR